MQPYFQENCTLADKLYKEKLNAEYGTLSRELAAHLRESDHRP